MLVSINCQLKKMATMLYQTSAILFLLSLFTNATVIAADASVVTSYGRDLPVWSLKELKEGTRLTELNQVLRKEGALIVQLDEDFSSIRQAALQGLCQCQYTLFRIENSVGGFGKNGNLANMEQLHQLQLDRVLLPDSTVRSTVGTATIGQDHLLPLPEVVAKTCGRHVYDAMEGLREEVKKASDAFIAAWDNSTATAGITALYDTILSNSKADITYRSIHDIQAASHHLEHFHIYNKPSIDELVSLNERLLSQRPSLDFHTDAGLFLAAAPAMDCNDYSIDQESFYLDNGSNTPLALYGNQVLIMLGAAAQYALHSTTNEAAVDNDKGKYNIVALHAARHALKLSPGRQRAWYGKMHLVPMSTQMLPTLSSIDSSLTFGDLFKDISGKKNHAKDGSSSNNMQIEFIENDKSFVAAANGQEMMDGCSIPEKSLSKLSDHSSLLSMTAETRTTTYGSSLSTTRHKYRRLQDHKSGPIDCNNVTNFFCWFQCMDIPEADMAQGFINEHYSLYCLDPAVLARSGNQVSQAVAPCEGGYNHNSNCLGSWQPTAPGVPAYPVSVNKTGHNSSQDDEEFFCHGSTSMYMQGFEWMGSTCVVYLFPQWVLSSAAKFTAACIGSVIFGVIVERIVFERRRISQFCSKSSVYKRLALSGIMYGLQLSAAYLIMLVIMTYSGPLFISIVVGMMLGHVLFNAQDATFGSNRNKNNKNAAAEDSCDDSNKSRQSDVVGTESVEENNYGSCCSFSKHTQAESGSQEMLDPLSPSSNVGEKDTGAVPEGATPCCQHIL